MVPKAMPTEAERILDQTTTLTIAIRDSDGCWAAPLFFARDKALLIFMSSTSSRHCGSGALEERVGFAAYVPSESWREICGVQGAGWCEPIGERGLDAARERYCARFSEIRAAIANPINAQDKALRTAFLTSAMYRIIPDRLRVIDNRRGFAFRTTYRVLAKRWCTGGVSEASAARLS